MLKLTDGHREYKVPIYQYLIRDQKFSGPAQECLNILREIFPLHQICAEIPIPTKPKLYLDFYLPLIRLGVEVHGRQHTQYTKHFHGSREGYLASIHRDEKKKQFLSDNNIKLIILYDGDKSQWRTILSNWIND